MCNISYIENKPKGQKVTEIYHDRPEQEREREREREREKGKNILWAILSKNFIIVYIFIVVGIQEKNEHMQTLPSLHLHLGFGVLY